MGCTYVSFPHQYGLMIFSGSTLRGCSVKRNTNVKARNALRKLCLTRGIPWIDPIRLGDGHEIDRPICVNPSIRANFSQALPLLSPQTSNTFDASQYLPTTAEKLVKSTLVGANSLKPFHFGGSYE